MKTDIKEIEKLSKKLHLKIENTINFDRYIAYSLTHHATAIEGSTLTESQVFNLLEFDKATSSKPFEHHFMVSDFYKAFLFMLGNAIKKNKITPQLMQQICGKLLLNTGRFVSTIGGDFDTSKGDFRLCAVRVSARYFPDYKKVPKMVENLCDTINKELPKCKTFAQKIELSFKLHYELVSIHPFGDGNGRTSRLMMNYLQHQFKIPMTIVFKEDRLKYYEALENTRKEDNIQIFYAFMYGQHLKFVKKELKV